MFFHTEKPLKVGYLAALVSLLVSILVSVLQQRVFFPVVERNREDVVLKNLYIVYRFVYRLCTCILHTYLSITCYNLKIKYFTSEIFLACLGAHVF